MHPILFELGPVTIYTYGFCVALGAVLGFVYMAWQGKKLFGTTFDQSNTLFILLVLAGFVGGKFFMLFENPSHYFSHGLIKIVRASGVVMDDTWLSGVMTP